MTPSKNEIMILEVLEALEPAVFRQNLFNTLTHYYKEIQCMSGAGGRPKPKSFKLKMNAGDGLSLAPAAAVMEHNDLSAAPASRRRSAAPGLQHSSSCYSCHPPYQAG
jgi:hypothetical protein